MSDLTRPGQASFIAEARRLLNAIEAAKEPEAREAAEHDLSHFLRMNAAGRLPEYFRNQQAVRDQREAI